MKPDIKLLTVLKYKTRWLIWLLNKLICFLVARAPTQTKLLFGWFYGSVAKVKIKNRLRSGVLLLRLELNFIKILISLISRRRPNVYSSVTDSLIKAHYISCCVICIIYTVVPISISYIIGWSALYWHITCSSTTTIEMCTSCSSIWPSSYSSIISSCFSSIAPSVLPFQ